MSNLQLLLSTVRAGDISLNSNMPFQLFSVNAEGGKGSAHPASTTSARSGASITSGHEYHNVPIRPPWRRAHPLPGRSYDFYSRIGETCYFVQGNAAWTNRQLLGLHDVGQVPGTVVQLQT